MISQKCRPKWGSLTEKQAILPHQIEHTADTQGSGCKGNSQRGEFSAFIIQSYDC
jgi:hypothetical protein